MKKNIFKLGLASFLLFSLFSCGITSIRGSDKNYSEYSDFYLSSLDDFYSMEEDKYFIYLYSNSCSFCDDIKGNLFDHLEENKNNLGIKGYIFNIFSNSNAQGKENRAKFKEKESDYNQDELVKEMSNAKPSSISETYFFSTPSIYLIENHMFSNIFIGNRVCAIFLDSN